MPAYTGKTNKAVSQAVFQNGVKRGFAANDPRWVDTMVGMSGTATTLIAPGGIAFGAAAALGAPIWISFVAAAVVVGAIAALSYYMMGDQIVQPLPYNSSAVQQKVTDYPDSLSVTWPTRHCLLRTLKLIKVRRLSFRYRKP